MSVEDLDQIDFLSIDAISDEAVMTISDHLDWSDVDAHIICLQRKINRYIESFESGELFERFPEAATRRCVISVHFKFQPPVKAFRFIAEAQGVLNGIGLAISHRVHLQEM